MPSLEQCSIIRRTFREYFFKKRISPTAWHRELHNSPSHQNISTFKPYGNNVNTTIKKSSICRIYFAKSICILRMLHAVKKINLFTTRFFILSAITSGFTFLYLRRTLIWPSPATQTLPKLMSDSRLAPPFSHRLSLV